MHAKDDASQIMFIVTLFSLLILVLVVLWVAYHIPILIAGFHGRERNRERQVDWFPKISVVVPVKDEEDVVERCLQSLINVDYPNEKIEIIVVDGSSNSTSKICRRIEAENPRLVKVVREDNPHGKPSALNLGLKHAVGDVVAVFDADSVVEKDCFIRAVSHLRGGAVGVQGKTRCFNMGRNLLARLVHLEQEGWQQLMLGGREKLGLFVPFTGSCLFIRRDVLQELGGWREDSLAEDVELSVRLLLERNLKVKFAPDVFSWQEAPSKLKTLVGQRDRWYRGYMEVSARYLRLLRKPCLTNFDAEMLLFGPFYMAISIMGYLCWLLNMVYPASNVYLAALAYLATALTCMSIVLSLLLLERPINPGRLALAPFLYVYWIIQSSIALKSALKFICRRPMDWRKTEKEGFSDSR
jgi:cellulose synthase/poly-beta-1,6-N-acetylglucosamine synthase-like glycosyltransferase